MTDTIQDLNPVFYLDREEGGEPPQTLEERRRAYPMTPIEAMEAMQNDIRALCGAVLNNWQTRDEAEAEGCEEIYEIAGRLGYINVAMTTPLTHQLDGGDGR